MLIRRHPALLTALTLLALATLAITLGSEAYGSGALATSTVKLLGKTLCLALAAVALLVRPASWRTSSATTAKRLPASPAPAASIVALIASCIHTNSVAFEAAWL